MGGSFRDQAPVKLSAGSLNAALLAVKTGSCSASSSYYESFESHPFIFLWTREVPRAAREEVIQVKSVLVAPPVVTVVPAEKRSSV